jgi:hypothetical protein
VGDYRLTIDANEQYASHSALAALVHTLQHNDALVPVVPRIAYIEQPLPRELTWSVPLGDLGHRVAFIIDEADGGYDAFPKAIDLGYRGISSKACKGIYRSLLNGVRASCWNANGGRHAFMAAEDLTCQAGLAVQQDTAIVLFHGIGHAERNGHHYVDGFASTPSHEAEAFLKSHPDLYEREGDAIRLRLRGGAIRTASLAQPGFASGVDPEQVGRWTPGRAPKNCTKLLFHLLTR